MKEQKLLKQAIRGDHQAFLYILQAAKADLYRTAYAFLKNEQDVLDAIQEVTVRAYQQIHTVREPRYLQTWLVRIMINVCQDQLKRRERNIPVAAILDAPIEESIDAFAIDEALQQLTATERELIHIKYFLGLKNKEIAQLLEIPEGTVKSRIHHTLKKLKPLLAEERDDHV